ncbi:MAG: hypothetical protein ACLSE8_05945 [Parasutterella sp.]
MKHQVQPLQSRTDQKKNLAESKQVQEYPVQVEPFLPRMKPMGKFSAGVPNAGIYKLFDETDNIVCYVLMPNSLETKRENGGELTYNSNTIGSISCVRIDVQQPKSQEQALVKIRIFRRASIVGSSFCLGLISKAIQKSAAFDDGRFNTLPFVGNVAMPAFR